MVSGINTSVNGLLDAAARVQDAAQRVASSGIGRPRPETIPATDSQTNQITTFDPVQQRLDAGLDDSSRALIDQKIATYDFKANLRALKVQDENEKRVLDILG